MTTTPIPSIDRLPQYRNAEIKQRVRDYLIDGLSYARVTAALSVINKPALVGWAKNITLGKCYQVLSTFPEDKDGRIRMNLNDWGAFVEEVKAQPDPAKVAADLGSQAHALIHRLLEGDATAAEEIPPELRPAVLGAAAFLRDYRIQPLQTEFTVWYDQARIAGTIDCVGITQDQGIAIIDWKRSKSIYPEMAFQVASYARLFELTTGQPVKEAWVVRLPQEAPRDGEPTYEARQVSDIAESYRAYQLAAALQAALKENPWA